MIRTIVMSAGLLLGCSTATGVQAADWLARISDRTYVSRLSIPGTHDAATGNGFAVGFDLFGRRFALTQDKPLAEQWHCGIRAFDLRPAVCQGRDGAPYLHLFHGAMQTKLTMADALKILRDSLAGHPTEFAIIVMRHEDGADKGDARWGSLMNELLHSAGFKDLFAAFKPDLTVGELRGKILLLSRDEYGDTPVGAYVRAWTHAADFALQAGARICTPRAESRLYVQDFYDMSFADGLRIKCACIRRMLDFSTRLHQAGQPPVWVINHTSGYSKTDNGMGYPNATADGYRENASITNQTVIDYLADASHAGPTGLVMMDFAGENLSGNYRVQGLALTQAIIANNFRREM